MSGRRSGALGASILLCALSMSSTYLSKCASGATPARALRFERGRPIAEFSLGAGTGQASAPEGSDRQLWVCFDGECIVVRRDAKSPPASIDGRPLELSPKRIMRLPCRIELGDARWTIDEQPPPFTAHDASAIVRVSPARTVIEAAIAGVAVRGCAPKAVVASGAFAPVTASFARVRSGAPRAADAPNAKSPIWPGSTHPSPAKRRRGDAGTESGHEALVPAEVQRTLGDAHATSVMPLEVMLQRGLVPTAQAPEAPPVVPGRRRRSLDPRRREGVFARSWSRLSRGLLQLPTQRWLGSMQRRWLVWALALPLLPLLGYALSPAASAGSPVNAGFEATAWAASDVRTASAVAPSALAGARSERPASAGARSEVEPPRGDPRLPASDVRSGPTAERLAIDALAAGDGARARALYAALAERARDNVAFAEAARILSTQGSPASSDGAGSRQREGRDEGSTNGGTTHDR